MLDAGAGPGWASLDLAEIVGEEGRIIALELEQGMRIISMTPIVDVVQPSSFIWQWPASWLRNYPQHLADAGKLTPDWAKRVPAALAAAEADPKAIMITPTVMEIVAVKL